MKFYLSFFICFYSLNVFAQMPEWTNIIPKGYLNDYFIGKGASKSSRVESINLALEDALVAIIRTGSITINYSEMDTASAEQIDKNDYSDIIIVRKTVRELNISGESKIIKGLKHIESYSEYNKGIYESWVLVNLPKAHPIAPPNSFDNVWRSVIIPGWGQFHRCDKFKSLSFLTLTAGSVISGLVFNKLSDDASRNAIASHTQSRRDFYNDRARTYNTLCTISIISAVAFYIWNVTDAIVIKKDNLYVDIQPNINNIAIKINFGL